MKTFTKISMEFKIVNNWLQYFLPLSVQLKNAIFALP